MNIPDHDESRPLDGMRMLDVSTYIAGPSGASNLAQLGAGVIRIDTIGSATDVRRLPVDADGYSRFWVGLNEVKCSVEIDLSSTEGRELVGVLLSNSGPDGGITNATGQSWTSLGRLPEAHQVQIMVHIGGRLDGKPAVDCTVNCEVDLPYLAGPSDFLRPVNHILFAWELLTDMQAATAVFAADQHRSRTADGRFARLALADVVMATMTHLGFVADMVGNGHVRLRDGNYLYGSFGFDYRTADRDRVMVVALIERHWRTLVELTGTAEAISVLGRSLGVDLFDEEARYRYCAVLAGLLAPWFEGHTTREVHQSLDKSQVLWGRHRTVEELVRKPDSLMVSSRLFETIHHPSIGPLPTPRSVLEDAAPPGIALVAPHLGQYANAVFGGLLSLDDDSLADLRTRDVIGTCSR